MAEINADETLDCVGLYCPMPIVKTSSRIKEMGPGDVLEVLSDDRGIRSDMPAWCEKTGNEFLGMDEDEESGEIRVYVRKKG